MIRIDAAWLVTTPLDMRAGTDTALARVIATFGAAQPHHAYVFANQRANRLKVLVHDGVGLWLAARRLHQGKFVWAPAGSPNVALEHAQLNALVLGRPGSVWARKVPSPWSESSAHGRGRGNREMHQWLAPGCAGTLPAMVIDEQALGELNAEQLREVTQRLLAELRHQRALNEKLTYE